MAITLYNSLTKQKEEFESHGSIVTMYHCGPTVYDVAHIGNLRSYVFADLLRKTFEYNGYTVKQVINITDIGHLASDGDEGEDKMTKALKREGKPLTLEAMREVADFYFEKFKEDITKLAITLPTYFPFASDHINEDISLIETLIKKKHTYTTSDGIYFATDSMNGYGKLGGLTDNSSEQASRIGINSEKKNPKDFALWKFNDSIGYEAPFGKGFPGWHIECSAMSMKYLGECFDIHTGGIDHIPIHHNNEIAQSECATGKPLARFWMHNEFLTVDGEKIAKSVGNTIHISDIEKRSIDPRAFRLLLLMAHYRSRIHFSWDALDGASQSLKRLRRTVKELHNDGGKIIAKYEEQFKSALNNDLNSSLALSTLHEMLSDSNENDADRYSTALHFDSVLSLGLADYVTPLPEEIMALIKDRDLARKDKNWALSDLLRDKLTEKGYLVMDGPNGTEVEKL